MADDQFQDDQPGFDGLAEAHVVGDQQVDPRHLDRAHDRIELVVLARCRCGMAPGGTAVGLRGGAPADGIEECLESPGSSKPEIGQPGLLEDRAPGSSSQTTWISSPSESSSTETRLTKPCRVGVNRSLRNADAPTSSTTHCRPPNLDQLTLLRATRRRLERRLR